MCAGVVIELLNIFVHIAGGPIIGSGVDIQHFPIMSMISKCATVALTQRHLTQQYLIRNTLQMIACKHRII